MNEVVLDIITFGHVTTAVNEDMHFNWRRTDDEFTITLIVCP